MEIGESAYTPKDSVYMLENKGLECLVVIEVQFGSYLEEDDIDRFEDMFDCQYS